jgi:chromosome segregation ATPase
VWFEGISGQAGTGRIARGGNVTEGLTDRLVSAEREAGFHERDMSSFERERIDLEHRVNRMEAELESLRKRRLEAYARWWNARDDRDRARHVCRRLRRKIDKVRRRGNDM